MFKNSFNCFLIKVVKIESITKDYENSVNDI